MNGTRTWRHSRKGLITGRVVREDDTWVHITLDGSHALHYSSEANRGRIDGDGEVLTARKSLLAEVDPAPQRPTTGAVMAADGRFTFPDLVAESALHLAPTATAGEAFAIGAVHGRNQLAQQGGTAERVRTWAVEHYGSGTPLDQDRRMVAAETEAFLSGRTGRETSELSQAAKDAGPVDPTIAQEPAVDDRARQNFYLDTLRAEYARMTKRQKRRFWHRYPFVEIAVRHLAEEV